MPELSTTLLVGACLLTWAGFALLALTQERHFGVFYTLFRPVAQWLRAQRAIGIIAICLALPICIKAQSASFGSLLWLLMLTASAMTVALQLTWAAPTLRPLAWLVRRLVHDSFVTNLTR